VYLFKNRLNSRISQLCGEAELATLTTLKLGSPVPKHQMFLTSLISTSPKIIMCDSARIIGGVRNWVIVHLVKTLIFYGVVLFSLLVLCLLGRFKCLRSPFLSLLSLFFQLPISLAWLAVIINGTNVDDDIAAPYYFMFRSPLKKFKEITHMRPHR